MDIGDSEIADREQLVALPELMKAYLVEYRGACRYFGMVTSFLYVGLPGLLPLRLGLLV